MDRADQWVLDTLQGVLPERILQLLRDHVLQPQSPFQIVKREAVVACQHVVDLVSPMIVPVVDRVVDALQDSPDFVVLGVLLAFILVAFQILLWIRRLMMFWTRLMFRLMGWALVALVIAAIWQRGPEAVAEDVVVFASKVMGYATVIREIWLSEYRKYNAQTADARRAGQGGSRRTGRHR